MPLHTRAQILLPPPPDRPQFPRNMAQPALGAASHNRLSLPPFPGKKACQTDVQISYPRRHRDTAARLRALPVPNPSYGDCYSYYGKRAPSRARQDEGGNHPDKKKKK